MRELLHINGETVEVTVRLSADGKAVVRLRGKEYQLSGVSAGGGDLEFVFDGRTHRFSAWAGQHGVEVADGAAHQRFVRVVEGAAEDNAGSSRLVSQMPGTVLKTLVAPGTAVTKGTPLLILEAMKMEHEVCAPSDGTVTGYPHAEGQRVMPGDLLVEFEG